MVNVTSLNAPSKVFNQSFSCKNPLVMPVDLDFTNSNTFQLDITSFVDQGYIDFVNSIYFDFTSANFDVKLTSNLVKQTLYLQQSYAGYLPVFLGSNPKLNCEVSTAINTTVQIFVSNIPFFPFLQKYPA